jgi:hypothetical protein
MNKHPSGRPIRQDRIVSRPIWRVPDKGPVTPRLQEQSNISAIGFMAQLSAPDDE